MERQYVEENNKSRERLVSLVKNISDEELKPVIYKEGWTVAVMLGHLAFWDERRLALVKRWRKNELIRSDIDGLAMHTINDALLNIFLTIPPRKLAEAAVRAAEAVDRELAEIPDELLPTIEAMNDRGALDRAFHRKMHLDEIEALQAGKWGRRKT
jgi:hypothetical protein